MGHLLITGATGGMGRALCHRLREHRLTLVARDAEAVEALAASLPAATGVAADVRDEAGWATISQALAAQPPVDGTAHLVGSLLLTPVSRCTREAWDQVLATNLTSAFLLWRVLAGWRRPGSLVFMSSVAAGVGLTAHEAIAAAKAGVEGLMRTAAATGAAWGLRVNAVAPGLTETPMTAGLIANPATRQALERQHPLGRLGTPDEVAAVIAHLLVGDGTWITGQVITVDGGYGTLKR